MLNDTEFIITYSSVKGRSSNASVRQTQISPTFETLTSTSVSNNRPTLIALIVKSYNARSTLFNVIYTTKR